MLNAITFALCFKSGGVFIRTDVRDTIAYFLRLFSSSGLAGSLPTNFLNFFNTYGMCSLGMTFVSSEFRDCLFAVLRRTCMISFFFRLMSSILIYESKTELRYISSGYVLFITASIRPSDVRISRALLRSSNAIFASHSGIALSFGSVP